MSKLEPAASVIRKFGGPEKFSKIVGLHRVTVSNWMRSKEVGGTGGKIPNLSEAGLLLLAEAKQQGIDLHPGEFFGLEAPSDISPEHKATTKAKRTASTVEYQSEEPEMKSHPTQNDLKSNAKKASIEILNARLAEGIDLALLTKQAHWNVKGPQFIAIHEMLDGFRKELDGHVDTIAERAVQLGGTALGTSQAVAAASTLPPYPTDIYTTKDHIAALIGHYAAVVKSARAAIDEADEAGDAGTADIFTAYSRGLDKALWFLEAHVQEKE